MNKRIRCPVCKKLFHVKGYGRHKRMEEDNKLVHNIIGVVLASIITGVKLNE